MADNPEEFLRGSLDDYLLAVADSIHQAQMKLSRMRIPAQPGQPAITYQLPRLDFELKMSFEIAQKSSREGAPGSLTLNARPISAHEANSRSAIAEAASVIKGSFVAVPTDGGKPPSIVRTFLHRITPRILEITVSVQSATGEALGGIDAHFNIDVDKSRSLNERAGLVQKATTEGEKDRPYELNAGTYLTYGRVATLADGRAVNTLSVDTQEEIGTHIVIVVDVVGETQTIIFKVAQ